MVLNYKKYNESLETDFEIGDEVIVNGMYDSRSFTDVKAKIINVKFSLGSYLYTLKFGEDPSWDIWNVRINDKFKMYNIEKSDPIKEEDIEWF
jgi:hypothetical protein